MPADDQSVCQPVPFDFASNPATIQFTASAKTEYIILLQGWGCSERTYDTIEFTLVTV